MDIKAHLITAYRRVLYQVTLLYGYIRNKISPKKWPAYNKITDDLFLGRLPLKNNNDDLKLQQAGIGAVLSCLEKFENHSAGLLTPVTPQDWNALKIAHCQVETPDFYPLSENSFKKGVEFIETQIKHGKKVYVHCKAGRGRSAAVVLAYLIKNFPEKFDSIEACKAYLMQCRPIITLNEEKLASIQAYLDAL